MPAHSIVTSSSTAGRARRSSSEKRERPRRRARSTVSAKLGRVDDRDVVVDQQVVQPDRRDRVAERLERHPVVAGRQLELDLAERLHAGGRYTVARAGL